MTQSFDLPVMSVLQGTKSLFLDRLLFVLTSAVTWVPLYVALIYMIIRNNKSFAQSILLIVFGIMAVGLAGFVSDELMKPFFMRYRPGRDMMLKYTIDVVNNYRSGGYGFISAHASNTMACVVFLSLVVRNKLFTFTLLFWSLLNCYTRIYLGVHFPSDVLAGIVWGAASGLIMYCLYCFISGKFTVQPVYVSKKYTSTGYVYEDIYLVATVFILLLMYAMFRSVFEL